MQGLLTVWLFNSLREGKHWLLGAGEQNFKGGSGWVLMCTASLCHLAWPSASQCDPAASHEHCNEMSVNSPQLGQAGSWSPAWGDHSSLPLRMLPASHRTSAPKLLIGTGIFLRGGVCRGEIWKNIQTQQPSYPQLPTWNPGPVHRDQEAGFTALIKWRW